MIGFIRALMRSSNQMLVLMVHYRRILIATTKVEISKRYAGSALGIFWVVLYPLLLLCIYLFVYLVVFKMRFPGYSEMDYVLYVFAGLVPFIGLSEAIQAGTQSIKQNIHLVKNVMLPIEIIPIRAVAATLAAQVVSLGIVVCLSAMNGQLSPALVALPFVFAFQFLFLIGIVFFLSALALVVQDITHFVNLLLMLLMFLSPIGFRADMVPRKLQIVLWLNPVTYLCEAYRVVLLSSHKASPIMLAIFVVISTGAFVLGATFIQRFKGALVDYE
ncbi:MAG: ABC transporter permease [Desulfobulbaceae bacterium]|nr:ABC transporter permease [Desulfobulbaceae bacterium]